MSIDLRTLEIGLVTLHEVRELRREVACMRKSGPIRGWTRHIPSPRLIPWIVALGMLAAGHLSVADLKAMLGIRPAYHTDGSR